MILANSNNHLRPKGLANNLSPFLLEAATKLKAMLFPRLPTTLIHIVENFLEVMSFLLESL